MSEDIHDFWEKQASEHGTSDLATAPDHFYRQLEIKEIGDCIALDEHRDDILDVGCGNGYGTIELAKRFTDTMFVGVDYSEEMIKQARKAAAEQNVLNVEFFVGDVLSVSRTKEIANQEFDIVVSCRCLINLANWPEQKLGILEMRKMLTPNGKLILVENTLEGLDNLNKVRKTFDLPPIQQRWHNKYLSHGEMTKFLLEVKGHLFNAENITNIGNMYYLISRVVYAALAKKEGKEPEYNHPLNEIASKMPSLGDFYACSPNFMFVLRNVAEHKAAQWENKKMSS